MKKKRVLSIFCIIIIPTIGAYILLSDRSAHQTYSVNLTENGFVPTELTIAKGDTIVFRTSRDKPFWPASNLHPTHEIYSAFDSKKPLAPNESWSFQFDRAGTWDFHDHLDSFFRGTIRVTSAHNADKESARVTASQSCNEFVDTSERLQCWQNLIREKLVENNMDGAFAALDVFTKENPSSLGDCHGIAHEIGKQAYALFRNNNDFTLSQKTFYCGYGFYHGFMETLMHTTNDMKQARVFCEFADKKLKQFIADAGGACFHGIGHGSVSDTPNPALWGDAHAIVNPALALCERVSSNESELFRCTSGAFNALEILIDEGNYKLSANKKDPFWICRDQPEKYKRACYTQLVVSAMIVAQNDFVDTSAFINTIPEDAYAEETLAGLAVERVRLRQTDYAQTIDACRALPGRFHMPCIIGFAEGFLKYGPPEAEYKEAMKFCGSELLTQEERTPCFERVLGLLRNFYTADISRTICLSAEKQYQKNNCEYR